MRTLNCPSCGGNIEIDDTNRDFAFCQYCGTKIMLDDYRSTHRIIDDARIKQAETDREIRLRELEIKERKENQTENLRKLLIKIWLVSILIISVLGLIECISNDAGYAAGFVLTLGLPIVGGGGYFIFKYLPEKDGEKVNMENDGIKFPKSVFPYEDKTYYVVESIIRSAGYVNVKTVNMHDVTLGILQKPNLVESITLNGKKVTRGGKAYPSTASIIITYHGK